MGILGFIKDAVTSLGGGGTAQATEQPSEVQEAPAAAAEVQAPLVTPPDLSYLDAAKIDYGQDLYAPEPKQPKPTAMKAEPKHIYADMKKGKFNVSISRETAEGNFIGSIKKWENPDDHGLTGKGASAKYMPFRSPEGDAGNKKMTEFEIGAGIKIRKSWMSDNPNNWPKIAGVPTDVRKGLNTQQLTDFVGQIAQSNIKAVKKLPKYDNLNESEKMFWADLAYNAGSGSFKANPGAMKAMRAGHTIEAEIRTFDFVNTTIGGKKIAMRGLLKRRISRYNEVARATEGVPAVKGYTWDQGNVKVKFAYPGFMSDKVSKEFGGKVDKDGWMKIPIKNVASPKKGKVYKDI